MSAKIIRFILPACLLYLNSNVNPYYRILIQTQKKDYKMRSHEMTITLSKWTPLESIFLPCYFVPPWTFALRSGCPCHFFFHFVFHIFLFHHDLFTLTLEGVHHFLYCHDLFALTLEGPHHFLFCWLLFHQFLFWLFVLPWHYCTYIFVPPISIVPWPFSLEGSTTFYSAELCSAVLFCHGIFAPTGCSPSLVATC